VSYPLPTSDRMALCETENVTLDGRRAKINGYGLDFAKVTIAERSGPQYSIEFAWPTVAHIVANRGAAFRS
jgi:hypothetical protein